MVIYLDQVLLLNGLVDYLLLVACGSVTATPCGGEEFLLQPFWEAATEP